MSAYNDTILADGPIAYYRLGDTSGTTAVDVSGNAYNGTYTGGFTLAQAGAIISDTDKSVLLNGTSGYIACPAGVDTDGWTGITVECWLNLTSQSFAAFPRPVANDFSSSNNLGFEMLIGQNGVGGNFYVGNGTTHAGANWNTTFIAGSWYHLVGTWDGSNVQCYVNGVLKSTSGTLAGSIGVTARVVNIGRQVNYNGDYVPGTMDEVSIYDKALSADIISAHYNVGQANRIPYRVYTNKSPIAIDKRSLTFNRTVGRRSQANFTLHTDNNTHFQQYQQVSIYDQSGALAFSGYITNPNERKPGFQPSLNHRISCTDNHFLADKRVVVASYTNKSVGYMVQDIYTNILASEGVTIGLIYDGAALVDLFPGTGVFPSTTLYPTEQVGIVPQATFVYCSVAQALDELVKSASASGVTYYWMIDQYKQLWFVPYTAITNSTLIDGSQIEQAISPSSVTRANPTYRNTQYIVGGMAQTVTQTDIRVGDGNTTAFTMDFNLSTVPTVSTNLNGAGYVAKSVGIQGVDSGKDWYWQQGSPLITQDSAGTKLRGPTGTVDLLKVIYIGQYPTVIIDQNSAQISYEAALDGSSGIIEEVESDATVNSVANGLAKTSSLLTRYAVQGTILECTALQTGFTPGQLVTVNLPDHNLFNVQMLIEDVTASDQIDGVNIWYTIKAVLGPYDTTWVSFFSTLLKQQAPANSINVGTGQSVVIAASGTANLSPSVTGSATPYACPIPSTSLFPDLTLFPC